MHVVIGTAGHIDHGKSALVKALTGTDPDRLKEERERGMTTDLGFAFLGEGVTVIDVPGHEKFVRHMLAGASTVDLVLLVVAADDAVMPQTREHLDICRLMGIRHGLVAVTKADLVDEEWLELVRADIEELVKETFLEGAPVLPVSSVTGAGIPELRRAIDEAVARVPVRSDRGVFRMPVDRCFSIKGFGTVVAGTVLSGRCRVGDKVELLPRQQTVRVRGIQRHEQAIGETVLGDRAALNLQGVEKESVKRGDVVATPGYYRPTALFNASFFYLPGAGRPLRNLTRVRVHIGTAEVMARVALLDCRQLEPGREAVVQYRLEEQVVCDWGDHYVVRSYSPQHTVGGGRVLEPNPDKEQRFDETTVARLRALMAGDIPTVVEQYLVKAGFEARAEDSLGHDLAITEEDAGRALARLLERGTARRYEFEGRSWLCHSDNWQRARAAVLEALAGFHREQPVRLGLRRPELRDRAGRGFAVPLFDAVTRELLVEGGLRDEGGKLLLPGHEVQLKPDEQALFDRVAAVFAAAALGPPDVAEAVAGAKPALAERVRTALLETGTLVDVGDSVLLHRDAVEAARRAVMELFRERPELTASEIRRRLGTTRRYLIPLLNHLDSTGLTQRRGDVRVLRRPDGAAAGKED